MAVCAACTFGCSARSGSIAKIRGHLGASPRGGPGQPETAKKARWRRPKADVRCTIEAAGASGDDNSQLLSARSGGHKAELDRQNTRGGAGDAPHRRPSTDEGRFIGKAPAH